MANTLSRREHDVESSNMLVLLGQERFNHLFPQNDDGGYPVIPNEKQYNYDTIYGLQLEPDSIVRKILRKEHIEKPPKGVGSNNWVIGSSKTSTGSPIFANDPHLSLSLPSIWYECQITTPNTNAYGVTIPGIAGIMMGFNEYISWALHLASSSAAATEVAPPSVVPPASTSQVSENREIAVISYPDCTVSDNRDSVTVNDNAVADNDRSGDSDTLWNNLVQPNVCDNRDNSDSHNGSALVSTFGGQTQASSSDAPNTEPDSSDISESRPCDRANNELRTSAVGHIDNDSENRTRVVGVSTDTVDPDSDNSPHGVRVLLNTASNNAINRSIRELSASFDNATQLFNIEENLQSNANNERDNDTDIDNIPQSNTIDNDEDSHEHQDGAWV